MKVIIAGSRDITDYNVLLNAASKAYDEEGIEITEIVSGGASGVDTLAERFAQEMDIPITVMKALWYKNGKYNNSAGILRNIDMANSETEALIALWDGKSAGTKHMIDIAKKKGLKVVVYNSFLERMCK